jgi:hypothetical protein
VVASLNGCGERLFSQIHDHESMKSFSRYYKCLFSLFQVLFGGHYRFLNLPDFPKRLFASRLTVYISLSSPTLIKTCFEVLKCEFGSAVSDSSATDPSTATTNPLLRHTASPSLLMHIVKNRQALSLFLVAMAYSRHT